MGSIIVLLIFILVLFWLRLYPRFWLILVVLLSKCWFPLMTVFLAAFFFSGLSQGRDVISQIEFNPHVLRNFTSPLALWFWAYNCWKMSSTILELIGTYNLSGKNERLANLITTMIPLSIGLLPIVLSIGIFYLYQTTPDPVIFIILLLECWLFLIYILLNRGGNLEKGGIRITKKRLHIASFGFFYAYGSIADLINDNFDRILKRKKREPAGMRIQKSDFREHWRWNFTGERFINWFGHLLLFTLIAVFPISFSEVIGPIGLIFISFSFFVMLGTMFAYLRKFTGQPFFKVIVIAVIVFSLVNDNDLSGKISFNVKDERDEMTTHFEKWLHKRSQEKDTVSITLVAAEGGGLRSAFWTYSVLRQMQLDDPEFSNELYAISSVSGSSIGTALFLTELASGLSKSLEDAPIINEDNLSPMIAGLFYREIAQAVIPFPVVGLDRSRIMDETFSSHWRKKHSGDRKWDENFLELWKNNPDLPSVFVNTTRSETGTNVVFSNLRFDSTMVEALDMMKLIDHDLSLSTVMGISARVPYFEPAAKFDVENGETWGHLVDGGYSENSGISTIYQVYLSLREQADELIKAGKCKPVKFSIVFLANGKRVNDEPCTLLNEIRIPLNTIMACWRTRGLSYESIADRTIKKWNNSDRYFEIKLNRKNSTLPLGWFFSTRSRKDIISQVNTLKENQEYRNFLDHLNRKK